MYEYKPQRTNGIALYFIALFFAAAIASFVASAFLPVASWIPQTIGLLLMVPMIQLITRYMATRYLYRICPYEDGNVDLDIYAYRGGSQMQLVCRLGLEEITAAKALCDENRKPPKKIKRYNYCPEMFPRNALVLSITNGDGDCEIIFCPDERMAKIVTPVNGVTWTYTPPVEDEETEAEAENGEN